MKGRVSGMLAGLGIASDSFIAVCWEWKQLPKSAGLQAQPDVPKDFRMDVDTDKVDDAVLAPRARPGARTSMFPWGL